jgi:pimeloyl-ACP methyl ester carboxylesterase
MPSFADSLESIHAVQNREATDPKVNPDCVSILYEHGRPTPRAVVFLHGITSSPVQFQQLGRLFHERGYNVLIPRMPRHGYRDRLNKDQARITRAEFEAYAADAVAMGRGLGEHLSVVGLSVSGVLTGWCAQLRAEVDLAVLIAPSFAPFGVPLQLVPALARLARLAPNAFVWWDPRVRAGLGPPCSYPRFSTHALAESFLLGADVYHAAVTQRPRAEHILTITNPRDPAVNNAATRAVVRRWRAHALAKVQEYQFGRDLGPIHDVIAPYQPYARIELVHPIVFDLIDSRLGA